jgi:hypothetical protein
LTCVSILGCYHPPIITKNPGLIIVQGVYQHELSGIKFPEYFYGFKRGDILKYDKEGRNTGIGYNLTKNKNIVAATIYIYPIPHSSFGSPQNVIDEARRYLFENHYKEVKQDIIRHHQSAKVIDEMNIRYGRKNG